MLTFRVDGVLLFFLSTANLAKLSAALTISYPTNETNWARGEALRIDWISSSNDPSKISITLTDPRLNPPFLKTIVDGVSTSVNSFTAYADASVPAGSTYQVQLVQRMNASDNIMATSAEFSIATSVATEAENSSFKSKSILPGILAVPAVVIILIIAGSAWFCWFQKRRRRDRSQARSPSLKMKCKSPGPFDARSQANSTSPLRDTKPDVEERNAEESLEKRESLHDQTETVSEPPFRPPLPPPPPPSAAQNSVELPLFVTPRSSRQKFDSLRRLRSRAELDIHPPSPRPQSVDETKLWKDKIQSLSAAHQSRRYSLPRLSHLRKFEEPDVGATTSRRTSKCSTDIDGKMVSQDVGVDASHCARRSKRVSLQHIFHLRRIAELEGSSAFPNPLQVGTTAVTDEESQVPSARRSRRISLYRLLHSRTIAELEANVDVLPQYSRTERYGKSLSWAPPLPPKDTDVKDSPAAQPAARRAVTPVELDAAEPEQLRSPQSAIGPLIKSLSQSIAGGVGSSSTSVKGVENQGAVQRDDEALGSGSDVVPGDAVQPFVESTLPMPIPHTLEAVDFLDLTCSESEGEQSEHLNEGSIGDVKSPSKRGTPLASPGLEVVCTVPSSTSRVTLSAPQSSAMPLVAVQPEHQGAVGEQEISALPSVHEMDATELSITSRSKKQGQKVRPMQSEGSRRRPDFATFKKQMSEAERKAKMIAKRRKSRRRTFKSF